MNQSVTLAQCELLSARMERQGKKRPDRIDDLYKILLIGDMTVGKTGLLTRFTENPKDAYDHLPTIGIDFKVRTIELDGKRIKLQLWDTAGSERFRTLTKSFYRGSHGLIIVYDITNKTSFDHVTSWITIFKENFHADAPIPTILVGNKVDMEDRRAVNRARGELLAIKHGLRFVETSAKSGENVENAFLQLAVDIKKLRDDSMVKPKNRRDNLNKIKIRPSGTHPSKTKSWISKLKCSIFNMTIYGGSRGQSRTKCQAEYMRLGEKMRRSLTCSNVEKRFKWCVGKISTNDR